MAKKKTEETLIKQAIKHYLDLDEWFHFPVMQGMGSYPGLPDRIALKGDYCLMIEVKSSKGRLSDNQEKFRSRINALNSKTTIYIEARSVEDVNNVVEGITGVKKFLFSGA